MRQRVLFRHCDPAGIVFYPRYFEMINDGLEAFFEEALDAPWDILHKAAAVPTAEIKARFATPSRQGDLLILRVSITRVGRSSMGYEMTARCGTVLRFEASGTLVFVDEAGKATAWPADLRTKLEEHKENAP
ncbi:thioesterase family protein [Actibacterium sp. 188UL27-1]|uniref:acyl-CoA thioesterase n=1 Tax=Actibacterium sp. 188UL27-1 TaxID=2786961 RepID=UPI001EF6ADA1|nr:thioesterase family protein [Actibacterium sp. 188UL27-1]